MFSTFRCRCHISVVPLYPSVSHLCGSAVSSSVTLLRFLSVLQCHTAMIFQCPPVSHCCRPSVSSSVTLLRFLSGLECLTAVISQYPPVSHCCDFLVSPGAMLMCSFSVTSFVVVSLLKDFFNIRYARYRELTHS